MPTDQTHNPALQSWLPSANAHPSFPIQNLPFGIFSPPNATPRPGIAIGDHILDLTLLQASNLLPAAINSLIPLAPTLNDFLAQGPTPRTLLRQAVSHLLAASSPPHPELLHPATACTLHLPAHIPNYTDFYAGIHHALAVGRLFRPDAPLLPNYKWIPIGYHGRASSIRPSGTPVTRPAGQRKLPHEQQPTFGPTRALDFELELGIWIGPPNPLGRPILIAEAHNHIAGFCLLNDWSARDLQSWEYQPLGPFLAKSFHTTISPWIITPEALAPFRQPQPSRDPTDPQPLPYLADPEDQATGALNLILEVFLLTHSMRTQNIAPYPITQSNAHHLYWTPQQLLTHHTSNGCNLLPGDLLGTGTISAPNATGPGSLLELTQAATQPLTLPTGEQRFYLEDGDEILLRATAHRPGFTPIGFGDCRALIHPAQN